MKVRILSGSQAGAVVEQFQPEAESNIAFGFAEAVEEPAEPAAPKRASEFSAKGRAEARKRMFGAAAESQADGFGEENDEK